MPYKYVEVEWVDIISTAGWEKTEETKMPTFWSYGYLINHDDEEVRIATTKDEKDEWYGFTVMPIGCVKKITPLVEGGLSKSNKQLKKTSR
jgi:hypothetical protein